MNPGAATTALLCTIIVCAEGASSTIASANSRSAGATVLVIQRVRVFDGENVLPKTTVLVRDGQIAELGTKIEAPSGAVVIDGEGRTLLPGLIDAHAHVWSDEQLRQALAFGVTTELDMMTAPKVAAH